MNLIESTPISRLADYVFLLYKQEHNRQSRLYFTFDMLIYNGVGN